MAHHFADAEAVLREAANTERELAAQDLTVYGPDLVQTLCNLASLYQDVHRDSDAKAEEAELAAAGNGHYGQTMKTKAVGLVVVGLLVLAAGTRSVAADVTQTTGSGSWCSPAQNGNVNTVICNGVDPRALDRLNELLDRKDLDLKQKTAEANDWVRRYNELNAQLEETKKQLTAKGEDATLVQTAQDLLHEGKLDDAGAIFDRLILSDEADVDRAAQDLFSRAIVFELQFRLDKALPYYARAHQYRPDDHRYALSYASALTEQKDFFSAEPVLREQLPQLRTLSAQSPSYQPELANTLANLGIVYRRTRRFGDAEISFREAVDIRRELVVKNPAYRAGLGLTLTDLGHVYSDMGHYTEAEIALKEAVVIERNLAAQNATAAHRANLATALNSLGYLYRNMEQFANAEAALQEAGSIWRDSHSSNLAIGQSLPERSITGALSTRPKSGSKRRKNLRRKQLEYGANLLAKIRRIGQISP